MGRLTPKIITDTTMVTVNCDTPELIDILLTSLYRYYDMPVIIVDNSTDEEYRTKLSLLIASPKFVNRDILIERTGENTGHGVGLNVGMKLVETEYALVLDSDVLVTAEDGLERLKDLDNSDNFYIGGSMSYVNNVGIGVNPELSKYIRYPHPSVLLIKTEKFGEYGEFNTGGAPSLDMAKILKNDITAFNGVRWTDECFYHPGRGTRDALPKELRNM